MGSAANPRQHQDGVDADGEPIMRECAACVAAVESAAAQGLEVEGVGLGGPGGHCDCSFFTPGPLPDTDVPGVGIVAEATAMPAGAELLSAELAALARALGVVAVPAGPAVPADVRSGLRRTTLWWLKKEDCPACGTAVRGRDTLCDTCTLRTGHAYELTRVRMCPVCRILFQFKSSPPGMYPRAFLGLRVLRGTPRVVDVDLNDRGHVNYILGAMARLVGSLIATELILFRAAAKRATNAARDG